jgi:Holliday junction resolvase
MRRAAKRDGNERAIIESLEDEGCKVMQISGAGLPDLAVYRPETALLVFLEVKQRKGKLTDPQRKKFEGWPIVIARTPEAALAAMGIRKAA